MSVTPGGKDFTNTNIQKIYTTITGTTPATLWTPTTGRRLTIKGCALRASVATTLVGATPGGEILICDATNATPIFSLGVITTATDAAGKDFGFTHFECAGGYPLSAVNNALVLALAGAGTLGAGVVRLTGFIWGDDRP
jgi:hypothetical protein